MKRCWPLLILGMLLLMPGVANAGTYSIDHSEYAGTAIKGVPSTVQLKTPGGSSKYVLPSDVVGSFHQAYIRVGRTLNAENYLTVTFGDGYTKSYKDNSWATGGIVTIPDADFYLHNSRGITVSFTHSGDYDENLYLQGYWVMESIGGVTPPPAATPTPTPTPAPTVHPSATPGGTTSPNPTAGATSTATAQPSSSPGTTDPGDGEPEEPECTAACQTLIDQLECPQWAEYMNEWANMISSVIPPPPDWDMVADKIGAATASHIAAWAGSVPDPPSKGEIDNETVASLPGVDTSVETNGLVPQVPGDYNNGKINFDLNQNAPTIQVVDESQPFTITDPLADMPHDAPGVKVLPGDERNSTGGFKTPDHVDTGDPAPTPGKIVFELPPPAPIPATTTAPGPTPGGIVFDLPRPSPVATTGPPPTPGKIIFDLPPIPGSTSSVVPTPGAVDGIIPIPKGGE